VLNRIWFPQESIFYQHYGWRRNTFRWTTVGEPGQAGERFIKLQSTLPDWPGSFWVVAKFCTGHATFVDNIHPPFQRRDVRQTVHYRLLVPWTRSMKIPQRGSLSNPKGGSLADCGKGDSFGLDPVTSVPQKPASMYPLSSRLVYAKYLLFHCAFEIHKAYHLKVR